MKFIKRNKGEFDAVQSAAKKDSKIQEMASIQPCAGPCKAVLVKAITDPQHPAHGSFGLFAASNIDARSYILDYTGILKHFDSESKTSDYCLHFYGNYSIDAEKEGNEARFLNDYRGIGAHPIVQFDLYRDKEGQVRMGIFSLKTKIKKGSEILINYGKGFWKERGLMPSE